MHKVPRFEVENFLDRKTGELVNTINLGSYNYLGFADTEPTASDSTNDTITETIKRYGIGTASCSNELGTTRIVNELEKTVASFLGVEEVIVFGMGFATNSTNIAAIAQPGDLIISDALNHASIVLGCRLSGAEVVTFFHNGKTCS